MALMNFGLTHKTEFTSVDGWNFPLLVKCVNSTPELSLLKYPVFRKESSQTDAFQCIVVIPTRLFSLLLINVTFLPSDIRAKLRASLRSTARFSTPGPVRFLRQPVFMLTSSNPVQRVLNPTVPLVNFGS